MAAVKITVGADLSPAQQEIDKFQSATAAAAQKTGENLAAGVGRGAAGATAALGGVEAAAKKTAAATASIAQSVSLGDKIGMIGAFQAQIQNAIAPMLGLDAATTKAIGNIGGLASQGANIGKAFGPLPALLGGLLGGALGIAAEATDRYRQKARDLVDAKGKLETATLANIAAEATYHLEIQKNGTASIEAIQARILALKNEALAREAVSKAGGSYDWRKADDAADEIERKFKDLANTAGAAVKSTEDLKKELGLLPKDTLAELDKVAGQTKRSFDEADKKVAGLQEALKHIDSRSVEELEEKSAELAEALLDQSKSANAAKEANLAFSAASKEAEAAAAAAKGAVGGASGAYKDLAKNAKDAANAIIEVVVTNVSVFDETTGKLKTNFVNLAAVYDANQAKIVASIRKSRDELDVLTGGAPTALKIKAETDAALAEMEPSKVEVAIEVDPSSYDAALDVIESFATVAKKTFKSASGDFKEASKAFLTDALAASVAKVAENVEKGERAYKGLGLAVGEAAKAQILALGKTWAFKAGGEAAEAVANLAFGNIPGATLHGQAALMFGALAAAAGAGGGLLGRALPDAQVGAASPAGATSTSGGGSSAGASYAGGSTYQELTPVQYNLAPGGTVIFAGDARGRASYGRYSEGAIASGRSGQPTLKRS